MLLGAIGYATSLDGVTWMKSPLPALTHGSAGSADSFAAADPTVLKDGSTWKMWYTGDDSNKKRIAYATSVDGVTWARAGRSSLRRSRCQREHRVRRLCADRVEDGERLLDAVDRAQAGRR